jgi:hypothetical protein
LTRPPAAGSVFALFVVVASCGQSSPGRQLVVHTFQTSADGWQIAGDTGPAAPVFHATSGGSGSYISNTDEAAGETWYFQAPQTVLTQLAAAEGGRLEYSLRQDAADAGFADDDVVIVGPAGRLSYRFDYAPGTDWTDFSVPLSAAANWRWNWNARATGEQIRRVLVQPSRFEIRGEYRTGDDVGAMRRFVLRSPP